MDRRGIAGWIAVAKQSLAWDAVKWIFWSYIAPWLPPVTGIGVGLGAMYEGYGLTGVIVVALVTTACVLVVLHNGRVLLMEAAQSRYSKLVSFDVNGLRWWVQAAFFDVYRTLELPDTGTIDRYVTGPACTKCLHSLVTWGTVAGRMSQVVKTVCPGCGVVVGKVVKPLYQATLDAYHIAQAQARQGALRPGGA